MSKQIKLSQSSQTALVFISIVALTILDISVDLLQGVKLGHVLVEALILPLAGWGLFMIWRGLLNLKEENSNLKIDVARLAQDAKEWRAEASKYLAGLSDAIDAQLNRWNLTTAEKEIGLLLLKGLSHKEIAQIRETSERTVRHQANAVYEKSKLSGRAELAAFFLEDLLAPHRP